MRLPRWAAPPSGGAILSRRCRSANAAAPLQSGYYVYVSITRGNRSGGYAGADHILGHPAGVDDDVEIVLGDGDGSDEERIHLHALRAAREGHHAGNGIESGAAGQFERYFSGLLAQFARVLPDRDSLGAESDAIESGVQVGMTLYLFGLLLYTRVRHSLRRANQGGS